MKKTLILDAWVVLSYLEGNSVTVERLDDLLKDASRGERSLFISWINLGEVEYVIRRREGHQEAQETLDLLRFLPIEFVDVIPERIHQSAKIKARGELSYADAFVVGLSEEKDAQILTGAPEIIQTCPGNRVVDLSE